MKTQTKKAPRGKPFAPGNKGKQPGTMNKVNRLVKDFVSEVFNHLQEDEEAIEKRADLKSWAADNPKDFYNIASKLIQVQVEHTGGLSVEWKETKNYEPQPKTDTGT